jgi:putative transposase
MLWALMLAYITGTVDQELLLRNESLAAENRIPKSPIQRQVVVIRCLKARWAEIAQRLGRKALEELAAVAKPDTLLAWYRKLIANKFDGSKFRQQVGRPRIDEEAERLVVQMAKENPSWGYDRIVGALANLGFLLSDQTVGNILHRHGLWLANCYFAHDSSGFPVLLRFCNAQSGRSFHSPLRRLGRERPRWTRM